MLNPTTSNGLSGEESGSLYTDANIPLSNSDKPGHATAPSTGVSCLETNARTRGSPPSQQGKFSIIDESFGAADEDQILPGPSKKNPKRGTRSGSKISAQDAALQTTQENLAQKTAPGEIYRTFGQLQLTEEKAVQKSNSECKSWTRTYILWLFLSKPKTQPNNTSYCLSK